jgi:hypothetical protein
MLHADEATNPVDTRASTHAHFYEVFIKAALSRGRNRDDYDIVFSFLAFLAQHLFSLGAVSLSEEEFSEMHDRFEEKYDIKRSAGEMLNELCRQEILIHTSGEVSFKYSYLRYYFTASFLRDHIHDPQIRTQIAKLASSLYLSTSANVMLFLAHLSKDPLIISEVMSAAGLALSDVQPATLDREMEFL